MISFINGDFDGRSSRTMSGHNRSNRITPRWRISLYTKEIILKLYEVSEASDINVIDDKTAERQSSFPCSKICLVILAVFTILSAVGIIIVLKLYFGNKFGDRFKIYMPAEWFHNLISLNPYWQIMETKSKNWEITHRVSRKQNPEKF